MTITSKLRYTFPRRYARKDARTAIYRAVYGPLQKHHAVHPRNQDRIPLPCNWTAAAQTIRDNWHQAQLPESWIIIEDFNRLAGGAATLEGLT